MSSMASEIHGKTPDGPKGLGGWLLLQVLGLFVSIFVAFRLFMDGSLVLFEPELWVAYTTPGTVFHESLWVPIIVIGALVQLAMVIFSVAALVAIFTKKRFVPKMMIGIYLLGLVLVGVDSLLAAFFVPQIDPALAEQVQPESLKKLIGVTISAAIWIPYFLKSKRVKNTFVN